MIQVVVGLSFFSDFVTPNHSSALETSRWINPCDNECAGAIILDKCLRRHTHTHTHRINCSIMRLILFGIWHVFAFNAVLLFFSLLQKNIHMHFTWSAWHWIISKSPTVPCRLSAFKTFSLSERSMKYNLWPSPPIRVKHEKIPPVAGWKCRARDKVVFCSL